MRQIKKPSSLDRKELILGYWVDMKHYRSCLLPREDGCIEWIGAKHRQGYGFIFTLDTSMGIHQHKMLTAHKLTAMIRENRRLSRTEYVVHTCGNMACVNPDHLIVGDRSDIVKVMRKNGKTNAGKRFENAGKYRQNRRYDLTIEQMYFVRDHKDDVDTVAHYLKTVRSGARAQITKVLRYQWLDHFNLDGTLKKDCEHHYAGKKITKW